jgi:hypothetical protein
VPTAATPMTERLVRVCRVLRFLPGSRESDAVALRIVDLAKGGVRDARTLASLALRGMDIPID